MAFFKIKYHPDDAQSAETVGLREALRKRGWEWEEVAEEKYPIEDIRMDVRLDTEFASCFPPQDDPDEFLSHFAIVDGVLLHNGMDTNAYHQKRAKEFVVPDAEEVSN